MSNGFVLEPATFSDVTASGTATGYSPANVGLDNPGKVWKSDGGATENIVFDLGADTAFDTITMHGLRDATIDWQVTVEIATAAQGNFTGAYWSDSAQDLLAGSELDTNSMGRGIWQAPIGAPSAGRYVRLAFSALDAAIEIARVCIGAKLQLAQNFSYGAAFGIRPTGTLDINSRGVPIVREGVNLRGVGLTCEAATRSEVEGLVMPLLQRIGNTKGVAVVIDPDADTYRQGRIYFGFLTGDLGTVWPGYNRFVWAVNLVAVD